LLAALRYLAAMYQPELPGLEGPATRDATVTIRPPSARYSALLERHRRLLGQVAQARQHLTRLQQSLHEQASRLVSQVEPLRDRLLALDGEIHALFAELLRGRRLPARARRLVRELYKHLQDGEVLSSAAAPGPEEPFAAASPPPARPHEPPPADLPSAPRPEDGTGKSTLRGVFRRLAQALHPDRAGNGADAEAREEAMKAVNRAYCEGDLARLLEIERLWDVTGTAGPTPDQAGQREKDLEEINQALQQQLEALRREHRQLQRSEVGRLASELRRRPGGEESFLQEGREAVERLEKLRDFVRSFRDGRISLGDFVAGSDLVDQDEELDTALSILADWIEQQASAPPRPRRKRGGKRSGRRK
jgi:hypothetical protein